MVGDCCAPTLNSTVLRLGLSHDPRAPGEQVQAITLQNGVKPEDRILSRDILRLRQEEKE